MESLRFNLNSVKKKTKRKRPERKGKWGTHLTHTASTFKFNITLLKHMTMFFFGNDNKPPTQTNVSLKQQVQKQPLLPRT